MKTFENLKPGDVVAFEDPTDGVVVDKIDSIEDGLITVYYLYSGYKSTSANLDKEGVLAIGNSEGEGEIEGWGGKYDILQPEKLKSILEKKRNFAVVFKTDEAYVYTAYLDKEEFERMVSKGSVLASTVVEGMVGVSRSKAEEFCS